MKRCTKCGEMKPFSEFSRKTEAKDGLTPGCKACVAAYRASRREEQAVYDAKYYASHRKERAEYERSRKVDDPQFKLACNLRARLGSAIKNHQKSGSAVRDLGCTIAELKEHLEEQFQLGMTWDNYGDWHLDHILPLASFNLENRDELLEACHYSNLQPLWAADNLSKGCKVP